MPGGTGAITRRRCTSTMGGFERCPLDSQIYRKKEPRIRMEAHGDDVAAAAQDREAADWHMDFMTSNIDCKGTIMGLGPGESREEKFLKDTIRVNERGWELEHNAKHVDKLLKMHGLDGENAKGAATPWDRSCEEMPNADEKLPGGASDLFKTGTGIAHYLSKKRYDIQYAVKECRREWPVQQGARKLG